MRDTPIEIEPPCAARVFGSSIELARRYVSLLATDGIERGLIGPREADRLWTRHVLNCAVIGEAVPASARVVDIGSGAGLPGVCLALARPDVSVDLVEPLLRRTTFLTEVVDELGLARCRVVRGRAEEVAGAVGGADVLTARAVAPLAKLARWGAPLIRIGGTMMVMKGASAEEEVARDRAAVLRAGIADVAVRSVGSGVVDPPTTLVIGTRVDAPPLPSARRKGGRGGRAHRSER